VNLSMSSELFFFSRVYLYLHYPLVTIRHRADRRQSPGLLRKTAGSSYHIGIVIEKAFVCPYKYNVVSKER